MSAQAGTAPFQLINSLSASVSESSALTNTIHEVWYLFGYPEVHWQKFDADVVNIAVEQAGGTTQVVTVLASQRSTALLLLQPGIWVLARVPTIIDGSGGLALDANLITDGFMRLIYDFTTNAIAITLFNRIQQLQIIDSGGNIIFSGAPVPGLPPVVPIQAPANPSSYNAQGVHFDGATGLVAGPLVTLGNAQISFAGWFLINPASGQLEFSQGIGGNQLFIDTSPPAPAWCHMMGTIDAAANQAVLAINSESVGAINTSGTVPFSFVPTNGTRLYIGTDTQGNFFTGDIADLSIWFDTSWIENGAIPGQTIAKFVYVETSKSGLVTIQPINPALSLFGFNTLRQPFQLESNNLVLAKRPDVFLSGPASSALTPHLATGVPVEGVLPFTTVSGALTNSATNPSKITLTPT